MFGQSPPAPLHEHVSPVPVHVARSHPYRMRTRRSFPSARSPYIGITVPAVIAADPYMITAWPHAPMLHDGMWRTGPYYHFLSIGRTHQQAEAEQRTYD